MNPEESVKRLFEQTDMTVVRGIVKDKNVLLVSRYSGVMDQIYGVIGFYLGRILTLCGAKIEYINSRSQTVPGRRYDLGIMCHYDTDSIIKNTNHLINGFLKSCHKKIFYGNVVPCAMGFDKYFVSRKDYLNPKNPIYERECYSADRSENFEKSVFIGRGCDTVLLFPSQTEFNILVDASRGPPSIKVSIESFQLADYLEQNKYKVHVIGFKNRRLYRHHFPKLATKYYNTSYVYVSLISGLYELPVVETQSAGNWVISYKDALHPELLCPETTFKCDTPESLLETIKTIEKSHNPNTPRQFILNNGFKWTDVVNRMALHLISS